MNKTVYIILWSSLSMLFLLCGLSCSTDPERDERPYFKETTFYYIDSLSVNYISTSKNVNGISYRKIKRRYRSAFEVDSIFTSDGSDETYLGIDSFYVAGQAWKKVINSKKYDFFDPVWFNSMKPVKIKYPNTFVEITPLKIYKTGTDIIYVFNRKSYNDSSLNISSAMCFFNPKYGYYKYKTRIGGTTIIWHP